MLDVHILYECGGLTDPDDRPWEMVLRYLIYKNVRTVAEHGGSYDP